MEPNLTIAPNAAKILELLKALPKVECTFMEVCGTHTVAIFRSGIRQTILKEKAVNLVSGPGCPVCVTPASEIDQVAKLALKEKQIVLTCYGDMLRARGRDLSFAQIRERGANVRLVISPLENLKIAEECPDKTVLFFSIGFETTQPSIAHTVREAKKRGISNFCVFVSHKLIVPILEVLLNDERLRIEGFILPGHVSTIIGERPYAFIAEKYGIPAVIAGFEPEDVLYAVYHLLKMKCEGSAQIVNIYKRAVRKEGNPLARKLIDSVFQPTEAYWRGIGLIPRSGHKLRDDYSEFDATRRFGLERITRDEDYFGPCRCGEVLLGLITPLECPLFANQCTPEAPIGACMVSSEGTCANYFRYGERK